jgi:hypothetical protein
VPCNPFVLHVRIGVALLRSWNHPAGTVSFVASPRNSWVRLGDSAGLSTRVAWFRWLSGLVCSEGECES